MKRDRWAWAVLLGVVPLVLKLIGTPAGEPVAEDFDFLRHALLTSDRSLLDGGGSLSFWRPLSHQLYYLALGRLILAAPWAVATIHVVLLAAGGLLLYRALRGSGEDRAWPGWAAAAAATFPLLAESTRTIAAWPTQFVDLGLFFFSALALHERSRRRMGTALLALLAALLCKEVGVVTGVMIAWWPDRATPARERWKWAIATAVLMAAWAALYLWVRRHAGLTLPHQIETDPAVLATPLLHKLWWGTWNSLRAVMSLALRGGRWDLVAGAASAALLAGAVAIAMRQPKPRKTRGPLADAAPWIAWGLGWFALASATLVAIYPLWQPNRSQFGSVGLGIAVIALMRVAGPRLVAATVAVRVAMVLIAPGPVSTVAHDPPDRGAFMDFERLSRLQRLMRDMRVALHQRYPTLPHGAVFAQHNLPLAAEYALGGSHALHVWYRDTTLQWIRFEEFQKEGTPDPLSVVTFEPLQRKQISFAEPAAARALIDAVAMTGERRYPEAIVLAARAESALTDTSAHVMRSSAAAVRAMALAYLGRMAEAESEATRSLRLYRRNYDANFLLGLIRMSQNRLAEAEAHLEVANAVMPGDSVTIATLDRVRRARGPLR